MDLPMSLPFSLLAIKHPNSNAQAQHTWSVHTMIIMGCGPVRGACPLQQ